MNSSSPDRPGRIVPHDFRPIRIQGVKGRICRKCGVPEMEAPESCTEKTGGYPSTKTTGPLPFPKSQDWQKVVNPLVARATAAWVSSQVLRLEPEACKHLAALLTKMALSLDEGVDLINHINKTAEQEKQRVLRIQENPSGEMGTPEDSGPSDAENG